MNPAAGEDLTLTLHIGTGKAGSTTIQFFMRDNRERLTESGVLYPVTPGRARHGQVGLFVKTDEELASSPGWHRMKESDPAQFRRRFRRRLLREIRDAGLPHVVLSDEEIYRSSPEGLARLRHLADRLTARVRVVVYLRRQDDHMVSRYQQGVKIGWVERLDEWVSREDMTPLYDYATGLRKHQRVLSPEQLVVRPFERSAFARGSLVQDFLVSAGIGADEHDLAPVAERNVSLDAECVEFLRLLNVHRVRVDGATPGLIDNRALVEALAPLSSGPVLTLPPATLDAFMAQWGPANREVARRHLPQGDGELFHEPRRDSGTTPVQHLDPSRVAHYAEAIHLDPDDRRALRELAEQEAARA